MNMLALAIQKAGRHRLAKPAVLALVALVGISCGNPANTQQESDGDSIAIFNGTSLDGWRGDTNFWRVEDGAIVGEIKPGTDLPHNTFLIWDGGRPADFEFVAEYRMTGNGNSGVNYRSEELAELPFALRGYQADIDAANTYTGQNYEERGRTILAFPGQQMRLPPVEGEIGEYAQGNIWTAAVETGTLGDREALKANINANDWNEIRIVAVGNHLKHYINGVLMAEIVDDDEKNRKLEGLIGLQLHTGPPMKIEFKNVQLAILE